MFVGEGPGQREDETGMPFQGPAGREFDRQLSRIGLSRDDVWVTNLCKCRPAGSGQVRDFAPSPQQGVFCADRWLDSEIRMLHPKIIVAMGVPAAKYIIGDHSHRITMEEIHGRIQRTHKYNDLGDVIVLPIYHPASVFRDRGKLLMKVVDRDFGQIRKALDGTYTEVVDEHAGKEHYEMVGAGDAMEYMLQQDDPFCVVAVDTEAQASGDKPLYVQMSCRRGEGLVVLANNVIGHPLAKLLSSSHIVMHNAAYDLPMLWKLGVTPHQRNFDDTMIMAWMLQDLPLGLKLLARQLCGMEMKDYSEMITPAVRDATVSAAVAKQQGLDASSKLSRRLGRLIADVNIGADGVARWNIINNDMGGLLGPAPSVDLSHPSINRSDSINYSARDPDATLRVYNELWPRIIERGMEEIYKTDIQALPLVARMTHYGMPVNRYAVLGLQAVFAARMQDIAKRCHELAGKMFSVGSDDQVASVIFGSDGVRSVITGNQIQALYLTPVKRRPKVNVEALEPIKAHHPIIPTILRYKRYDTMQASFIGPMLDKMKMGGGGGGGETWRIHGRINPAGTETGRYKHSDPNTAATPVRYEEGRMVRSCIEASPNMTLVSFDYSQIEMRVLAVDSKDSGMMRLFAEGRDIHAETAAAIWGVPLHVIQDEHRINPYGRRYIAKRGGFGTVYWISARGFKGYLEEEASSLGAGAFADWDEKRCQQFLDDYFKLYPMIKGYGMERQAEARRYGYIRDMWGRIRLLPQIRSTNPRIRSEGEREAVNSGIQSASMGIVKAGMAAVEGALPPPQLNGPINPILQVHDEVIHEVNEDIAGIVAATFAPMLEAATPNGSLFPVPIIVEVRIGRKWGEMKQYKVPPIDSPLKV